MIKLGGGNPIKLCSKRRSPPTIADFITTPLYLQKNVIDQLSPVLVLN
ncbi:hypothetical protein [Paenibacillus sp. PK3_47]|nr:hypothetical protein [Paenibacillus sp. PK3_47]